MKKSHNKFIIRLFFTLLLCLGGGLISGLVTETSIKDWYPHLNLPPGTPPNVVFPFVWTILYSLMAISLALFWSAPTANKKTAAILFFLQLGLNFIWSWLFFGLKNPGLALVDLLFLWIFLILTIGAFYKHTRLGAFLLLPYFIWVTYALYLNAFIWLHN